MNQNLEIGSYLIETRNETSRCETICYDMICYYAKRLFQNVN